MGLRFWLVTLAALAAAVTTGMLGAWQLSRAAEKQAMQADIDARAEALADACNESAVLLDGFEALPVESPRKRARRIVATVTYEAMADNAEHNTLIRNLDAAR